MVASQLVVPFKRKDVKIFACSKTHCTYSVAFEDISSNIVTGNSAKGLPNSVL